MNIIGIQWSDTGTCAAIKDNKVVCSVAEERFTKVKNDMSFPINALRYCINHFNKEKIDLVAVASKEFNYLLTLTHFFKMPIEEHTRLQYDYYYPIFYKKKKKKI